MNKLIIIGNLVRDPDHRTTREGKNVCNFTMAVNRRNTQEADYFHVTAWNNLADSCGKYLAKGRKVGVTGRVSVSTYTTQNGETRAVADVFADEVEFLSPSTNNAQSTPKTPENEKQNGFVKVN